MIKFINTDNHVLAELTDDDSIKTDIKGEGIDELSNMLIGLLKAYKNLGLSKGDLLELVDLTYQNND